MYAKIYKEIFLKNYALKKQVRGNIWVVKIDNTNYYLYVYEDTEIVEGFQNFNEAELLEYRKEKNTELRISKNREFLKKIKDFKYSNSYLFRSKKDAQQCLFDFDTFST